MDKYNLVYKYIMGILLLMYIGVMVLLNITTPKKVFSESENRKLEQAPHFSLNELFHGKFTSDYEKYISDQFAFRDFWIGVKSDLERAIGKNESNGVYLGKDGYLLQAFNKPDDKSFQNKIDILNTFAKSTPGLNKYFMLVPNSVKILSDKLPAYALVDDELQYINKVRSSIDKSIEFVDIYDVLNSKKNEYIFYKTDHHWTTKTAFYAYEKLGVAMGFIPNEENYFNIKKVTDSFYGSLYSKGGFRNINPDSIELYIPKKNEVNKVEYVDEHKFSDSIYNMEVLNKKDKYAVFFDGNHGLIKISTDVSNGKKLLVVKDSYANCLIPFLTGHYSEIYVVDPRYYSDDLKELIKSNSIKNMLILYNVNTFFEEESIENISTTETNKNSNTSTGPTSQTSTNTSTDTASQNTAINYKEFFKRDVFMGDSITDGISYCEFLDDANVCAKIGINISNTRNEVNRIVIQNPRNIYLLYGVNDMDDTMPSEWFVEQYRELVHRVKEKFPNSNIYIQSILPVAPIVEQKTPHINNKHINETNEGLINMAKQENVNYLNISSILNENNRDLYEPDGTHFKAPFYTLWLNYVANNVK